MPKGKPREHYPELYEEESVAEPEVQTFSIEEVLLQLKQAENEKDSAKALTTVGDAIERLSIDDREKLLGTPAVQRLVDEARERAARDGRPGTVVCDSKGRVLERVEWTRDAMIKEFGLVEWTPMETRDITFQGITMRAVAGELTTSPPQFRDIAMEAWKIGQDAVKTQAEIMQRNFGGQSMIIDGAGNVVWKGKTE